MNRTLKMGSYSIREELLGSLASVCRRRLFPPRNFRAGMANALPLFVAPPSVLRPQKVTAVAPVSGNGRRKKNVFFEELKGSELWSETPAPWSGKIAVLVTSLDEVAFPALCMARLYRERGDAENVYDELNKPMGMGRIHEQTSRAMQNRSTTCGGGLQLVAHVRANA